MPVSDYPFSSGLRFNGYDMLYIDEISSFLVTGGYDKKQELSKIAMFTNGAWFDAGQLIRGRQVSFSSLRFVLKNLLSFQNHRAQWFDNGLVVAGGSDTLSTESCTLDYDTNKFECVDITPTLYVYKNGVSFVVPSDFCAST